MYLCCKNEWGNNCQVLLKASEDGKEKIVEELIKAGADVTATDEVKYIFEIRSTSSSTSVTSTISALTSNISLIFTPTLTLTVILTLALTSI